MYHFLHNVAFSGPVPLLRPSSPLPPEARPRGGGILRGDRAEGTPKRVTFSPEVAQVGAVPTRAHNRHEEYTRVLHEAYLDKRARMRLLEEERLRYAVENREHFDEALSRLREEVAALRQQLQ